MEKANDIIKIRYTISLFDVAAMRSHTRYVYEKVRNQRIIQHDVPGFPRHRYSNSAPGNAGGQQTPCL